MNVRDVGDTIGNAIYRQIGRASSQFQKNRPLPVDVLEDDDSYLVVFDAPGIEKEDVQVRYIDGTVKVRVDRFREFREGFEMRFPGRSMALDGEAELPNDAVVTPDAGTARLTEYGTLNIEIPKEAGSAADEDSDTERITIDD